jgi:hypothetical protein
MSEGILEQIETAQDVDIATDECGDIESLSGEEISASKDALRDGMEMSVKMCIMYAVELLGLEATYAHEAAWDKVVGRLDIDNDVYTVVVRGRKKSDLTVATSLKSAGIIEGGK